MSKYSILISIICTITTSIIAFFTYKNNLHNKTREELSDRVRRDTEISIKLDMVIKGNVEMNDKVREINNKLDDMSERIARNEEQIKNAFNRIEKLEKK